MSPPQSLHQPRRPARQRLFRFVAILTGLAVVGVAEVTLRLAGVGSTTQSRDSLIEFSEIRPLFEKNASGDRYEIPAHRQVYFQPDSFTSEKPADEYRIFCFGGSTVQGRPYSIETSFTTWLELTLTAAQPAKTWEVVNCGGVSYASYRLAPILRETLNYEPDLFIIYTGHNEFLEDTSYGAVKRQPIWIRRMHESAATLRIYRLLRSLTTEPQPQQKVRLPGEVDALLDYQGGLAKYHRDDAWRDAVIAEYETNLRKMLAMAQTGNVPVLLINPVSNVRDTPPFKAESAPGFSAEQQTEFERRWTAAKETPWDDLNQKRASVLRVLQMDDRHAEANFLLAKVDEALGEHQNARQAYLRAKDNDVCPLRMLESMHDVLKEVASSTGTELIDVRAAFEAEAEFGLPGDDQLIDHVHPRIQGHQMIAMKLFDALVRRGIVTPESGWKQRQETLYRVNFEGLPENYFPESVARLRGLEIWTQGRVMRMQLPSQDAND